MLVGLCGKAGSGKTTLSKRLSDELTIKNIDHLIYSGDWRFRLDSASRQLWLQEKWKVGIDAYLYAVNQFSWWNFEQIYDDLDRLMQGNSVEIQDAYNRRTGKRDLSVNLRGFRSGIVIFENSILGGVEKLPQLNLIILLNTDEITCFERILKKDAARRNLPEVMTRTLITSYSENAFLRLLMESFAADTVTCNSEGKLGPYPVINDVSYIPVPVPDTTAKERRKATIFCDLDGSLIKHVPVPLDSGEDIEILEGSVEKLRNFRNNGYYLVITTSRPQSSVFGVIEKLRKMGLEFDQIVCDLPVGPRHLINDSKGDEVRAIAHVLERDGGIKNIDLP
jgi:uridine kinase